MPNPSHALDAVTAVGHIGQPVHVELEWDDDPEPVCRSGYVIGIVLPVKGVQEQAYLMVMSPGEQFPLEATLRAFVPFALPICVRAAAMSNPYISLDPATAVTGAHWGEAQGLVPERVKNGAVTFANIMSRRTRSIPIHPDLERALLDYFKAHGPFPNCIGISAVSWTLRRSSYPEVRQRMCFATRSPVTSSLRAGTS
jgi:hypothetical protein